MTPGLGGYTSAHLEDLHRRACDEAIRLYERCKALTDEMAECAHTSQGKAEHDALWQQWKAIMSAGRQMQEAAHEFSAELTRRDREGAV